jgi:hypothetical protein
MKSLNAIYIGLGLLVFILGIAVYTYQEGFQTTTCSTLLNCADCANTGGCGWCSTAKKCVEQNRMGGPKKTCTTRTFITSATQCPQVRPSFLNTQVSNELTGSGPSARQNRMTQPPPLIGGNCPSSDKVVEEAEKRLNEIVKNVVAAQMAKYNVPLKEGFFDQNKDIATMLLGSVRDKVMKMVDSSVEAAGYTAPVIA